MTKYAELAPKYGKETLQVINRVRQSRGVVMANFYAVIGTNDSTLLAATYAKKDRSGRTCRARGLDADDRAAAGIPKGGRSARGVMVVERRGALMFWRLTNVSVQGQEANDKQLRLGLKKLCETADEFKVYKGRYEVGSGTKEEFDTWWKSFDAPDETVLEDENLDELARNMGMTSKELKEFVAGTAEMNEMLGEMEKLEDLDDDPLDERGFELSERAKGLLSVSLRDEYGLARSKFNELWGEVKPYHWSSPHKEKAKRYKADGEDLEDVDLSMALQSYTRGREYIRLRLAHGKELKSDVGRLRMYTEEAETLLEEYESEAGTPTPEPLRALRSALEEAKEKAQPVYTAHAERRWEDGLTISKQARLSMRKVHVAVMNHAFEGSLALEVSQGTYTPGDEDIALLAQLSNSGVCLAMAMDWLGSGGSGVPGGTKRTGHVSLSHLKWQATYELDQDLGARLREKGIEKRVIEETGSRSSKEIEEDRTAVQHAVETARSRVRTAKEYSIEEESRTHQMHYEDGEKQYNLYASLIDAKTNGTPLDPEIEWMVDLEMDDLVANRDEGEVEMEEARAALREVERIAREYRESLPGDEELLALLEEDLETLTREKTRLTTAMKARLKQNRRMNSTYESLETAWRAQIVSKSMDSVKLLRAYGLEPVPFPEEDGGDDDGEKDEGDDDEEKNRVVEITTDLGGTVAKFLRKRLGEPAPGAEMRFSISVLMGTDGHALGLRVVRPAEDHLDWDIETFDPNFGAFRFTNVDDAVRWFQHLAQRCYQHKPWTAIRYYPVAVTGKKKSGGLFGNDVQDSWDEKYKAATEDIDSVMALTPAPTWCLDLVKTLKLRVDRMVAGSPTEMDYRVARPHLDQLSKTVQWLSVYGVEVHKRWSHLGRVLSSTNPDHATARKHFDAAAGLWASSEPGKGLEEYRLAHTLYLSLDTV